MHRRPCDLPEPRCRPWGLKEPVSPLPTGDRNHTGDRNLPLNSMLSPLSPVSPVARAREGFRSTIRFENPGRVQYARVDFSETCGDGGDTGDRGSERGGEALALRRRHATGQIGLDRERPEPGCRDQECRRPAAGAGAPSHRVRAAATATSAAEELRALATRVRRARRTLRPGSGPLVPGSGNEGDIGTGDRVPGGLEDREANSRPAAR
jgi:hypothetical protein